MNHQVNSNSRVFDQYRPVRRSADALSLCEGLGGVRRVGDPAAVRGRPGSGSALQRSRDLLVMPGRAHPRSESHFQMEGFRAEDRHNPLPHIALSITALKSAYENTAFLSTRTSAELRELLIPDGRE